MPAGSQEYIFLLAIVCHPGWKKVSDFQIIVSVIYSVKFKSEGEREVEGKNRTFRYNKTFLKKMHTARRWQKKYITTTKKNMLHIISPFTFLMGRHFYFLTITEQNLVLPYSQLHAQPYSQPWSITNPAF
jgi:hypothetical protein